MIYLQILKSLKIIFQVCIASHNLGSIIFAKDTLKNSPAKDRFMFAQLLGISEHSTNICLSNNLQVGKYVPFGDFDILIPYLIRRAEESSMITNLTFQNNMLNEELYYRFTGLDPEC